MNRSEVTRAVLWLDQIASRAKAEATRLRAELEIEARNEWAEHGAAPTWRLPDIATVSLSVSKEAAYVEDRKAFTEWVGRRHPSEIVPSVRLAWEQDFLSRLLVDDGYALSVEGERIPGLGVRPGGRPVGITIRATTEAKAVYAAVAEQSLRRLAADAGPAVPVVLAELEGTGG
jgi:hypothetical protein